jgi:hypothetical protein
LVAAPVVARAAPPFFARFFIVAMNFARRAGDQVFGFRV